MIDVFRNYLAGRYWKTTVIHYDVTSNLFSRPLCFNFYTFKVTIASCSQTIISEYGDCIKQGDRVPVWTLWLNLQSPSILSNPYILWLFGMQEKFTLRAWIEPSELIDIIVYLLWQPKTGPSIFAINRNFSWAAWILCAVNSWILRCD